MNQSGGRGLASSVSDNPISSVWWHDSDVYLLRGECLEGAEAIGNDADDCSSSREPQKR